jgi:membrane associated rhomboid family serine protease
MRSLQPLYVILGLYAAFAGGLILHRTRTARPPGSPTVPARRLPLATLLLTVAVALPTTLQLFHPAILPALQRDFARFAAGEWWRVVTPLFVQDGGIAGTVFNLVGLVLIGWLAEQIWGSRRMLVIFLIGGVVSEVVGFSWQPTGAGNSVGNLSLAASIAVYSLAQRPGWVIQLMAALALGADFVLLLLKDIHGVGAMAGVVLALALRGTRRRQSR